MILDVVSHKVNLGQITADFYVYGAVFNTLLANATTTVPVAIDGDADFLWMGTALASYSAAGIMVVAPDYLIQIVDTASNRNLQNVAQHVSNVTGTAAWPFKLPEPKIIKAGCILNVTLTNNTAQAALVNVCLHGFKVFYTPNLNRNIFS